MPAASGRLGLTVIGNHQAPTWCRHRQLIGAMRCARLIVSHTGTNPEMQRQMIVGRLEVDLVPQDTLAERVYATGSGGALKSTDGDGSDRCAPR